MTDAATNNPITNPYGYDEIKVRAEIIAVALPHALASKKATDDYFNYKSVLDNKYEPVIREHVAKLNAVNPDREEPFTTADIRYEKFYSVAETKEAERLNALSFTERDNYVAAIETYLQSKFPEDEINKQRSAYRRQSNHDLGDALKDCEAARINAVRIADTIETHLWYFVNSDSAAPVANDLEQNMNLKMPPSCLSAEAYLNQFKAKQQAAPAR